MPKKCPHCGKVLPKKPPTNPGDDRIARMTRLLAKAGRKGLTDDEMDVITKWGHQSTTPAMRYMRYYRKAKWVRGKDKKRVRRLTRRNCPANVNVLAKYL